MVKEIVKYPTTPSLEFGVAIRVFNDELIQILDNLKDTMEANNLEALAAFQIGSPKNIVVFKKDGEFIELINPTIMKKDGTQESIEKTAYFPNLSAKVKRHDYIKIMYDDRRGEQHFMEAKGVLSATLQRKIDYLFGANFRVKLDDEERKVFDAKLDQGTDAITDNGCPIVFKRDRILNTTKAIFVISLVALGSKFFIPFDSLELLRTVVNYSMLAILLLTIIYFFYAQYESREYKHCSSCQIGNIIGESAMMLAKLALLFGVNYFLLWLIIAYVHSLLKQHQIMM